MNYERVKNYHKISVCIILAMGIFWQSANACTIVLPPLRKQFRDSAHVFVGEVIDISDVPKNYKDKENRLIGGIVKFQVGKKWKGAKQSEISLYSDIIDTGCGGSPIDYFKRGEKYLIFAEKDYVFFIQRQN